MLRDWWTCRKLENGLEGDAWQVKRTSEFGEQLLSFMRDPLA